jgi:hypothetical protein
MSDKIINSIPKEVQEAWQIVSEFLHKNQMSSLWLDVDIEQSQEVTQGKKKSKYTYIGFSLIYTLKDFNGFRLSSNPIKINQDFLKKSQQDYKK